MNWIKFHSKYLALRKLKFVTWLNKVSPGKYCWADCVSWAYGSRRLNPFKIDSSKGCEEESKTHSCLSCYCGGWQNGVCFELLPKEEQEKIKEKLRVERMNMPDDMPF